MSNAPCSSRGTCLQINGIGVCHCDILYAGPACERDACPGERENEENDQKNNKKNNEKKTKSLPTCGGHGVCEVSISKLHSVAKALPLPGAVVPNSPGKCTCDNMWLGAACTQMECPNLCSNNGMCVVGECVCHSGFIGTDCSIMECKHGCGEHGICSLKNHTLSNGEVVRDGKYFKRRQRASRNGSTVVIVMVIFISRFLF